MALPQTNISMGNLKTEYGPFTGSSGESVPLNDYYRGGAYVDVSVTSPYDDWGSILDPLATPIPTNELHYCRETFIFRWPPGVGLGLGGQYVFDTAVTSDGSLTPSPIIRRWYWGSSTAVLEDTTYSNPDDNTQWSVITNGVKYTTFTPAYQYPYSSQTETYAEQLISATSVRLTPAQVNYFGVPYGGTIDLDWWTYKHHTWKAERTGGVTTNLNVTVPSSGEISLGDFRNQGN